MRGSIDRFCEILTVLVVFNDPYDASKYFVISWKFLAGL